MSEIIKDFKINNLIDEYNKYALFFGSYEQHIEKCYINHIINVRERNGYLKIINDLIRQLNTIYNLSMVELYESKNESLKNINVNENNIDELRDLIHIHKILGIQDYKDPFSEINKSILDKLGSKLGFPSIHLALCVIIGEQYKYFFENNIVNELAIYDKMFVPLSYQMVKTPQIPKKIHVERGNVDREVLINNCANITIPYDHLSICLTGYFIIDSLNIIVRTSQLCNNFIYKKKKDIELHIMNKREIDEKFSRLYLRNASICDILTMNETEFFEQIKKDYMEYNKLRRLSFMHLMNEFKKDGSLKSSIENMYNIIRLLLLGSEESVNIAGLLFGMAKEKRMDYDLSISDIIYKNLNYTSQIKLRKTVTNIKSEIDKIKTMTLEDVDLKKQVIICNNMPNLVKKLAFEKIEEMKASNNEYYKQLLYVKTLLNFPWPGIEDDTFFADIGKEKERSKNFLNNVIEKLDGKVYGHSECKESIKELIGKWIRNPSSAGTALGLSGPPGVGKTLIAKAIGDSLGIPFVQITLGGQNDGELLHGHGYTYSGSQPGMIIKKMVEAGNSRCIMYFDELDKACKRNDGNEIYNILIHITDPNTNSEFQDRFFQEIKFPLSKVLFVFSYNDSSLIDNILMDRIKEIDVKPFKSNDKKIIIDTFLLKEMCELVGFEYGSIKFDDDAIELIINQYTNEAGVRDLKRKLEKIFLKLNIDRIYNTNIFKNISDVTAKSPIVLSKSSIEQYLGKNNIHVQYIHNDNLVGVINGLYATDSGQGGVIPIQIFDNYTNGDDKFTLKLTGSQRRVMRESVISAFTSAIHCIREDIRNEYVKNHQYGFHIHTPSSAVPKDGPSAGCAFAAAFISRILMKKIRNDVAITGEIELTGKVTKIGGLQYKLPGAKRAGIKLVLVSSENTDDIEMMRKDYNDLFDDNFDVKLVTDLRDVLKYTLIDFDPSQII